MTTRARLSRAHSTCSAPWAHNDTACLSSRRSPQVRLCVCLLRAAASLLIYPPAEMACSLSAGLYSRDDRFFFLFFNFPLERWKPFDSLVRPPPLSISIHTLQTNTQSDANEVKTRSSVAKAPPQTRRFKEKMTPFPGFLSTQSSPCINTTEDGRLVKIGAHFSFPLILFSPPVFIYPSWGK